MTFGSKIGNLAIWIFALATIAIWFMVRQGTYMFVNWDFATHSFGQLSGLVGMVLFALTFILTTKLKFIENAFGGLDKVYKSHHIIGIISFILILFHPLLLVLKFIPSNMKQAALYLSISNNIAVNFGIFALVALTLLIILTLYVKMKYPNWKFSHKFMGLVFIIAMVHTFLVVTDLTYYPVLRYWMIFVSALGIVSYAYGSFLRSWLASRALYAVSSVENAGNINIVKLEPKNEKLEFKPGQFAFIRFLGNEPGKERHPFTIASSPVDNHIRFAIKDLGDYTSQINKIKAGDHVEIDGPHGRFGQIESKKDRVWIAGGIGITPFLSMINHLKHHPGKNKITLFYCVRNKEEAVFLNELNNLSKGIKSLKIVPWFSDDKGKITVEEIEKISGIQDKHFLICGPKPMMYSLSEDLRKIGLPKQSIEMEDFGLK